MTEAQFAGELIKQGTLGLLLAISLSMNGVFLRLLLNEKDKRIQEAAAIRDNIAAPMASIKESIERIEGKIVVSKQANRND